MERQGEKIPIIEMVGKKKKTYKTGNTCDTFENEQNWLAEIEKSLGRLTGRLER